MDRDHIDRLISDIQQFLKEEDQKKQVKKDAPPPPPPPTAEVKISRSPVYLEVMLLVSACATAVLTVAILLLGLFAGGSSAIAGTIALLSIGACGIFFTAVLLSIWRRINLLSQIEENTRLLLASRLEGNVLLERLMHK